MMRTRSLLAAATVAASMLSLSVPASAGEVTPWPELMKAADANHDGVVTRKEFLDHMGRMWDSKHAEMTKGDASMKKGVMNDSQFAAFMKGFLDPGQIGGR